MVTTAIPRLRCLAPTPLDGDPSGRLPAALSARWVAAPPPPAGWHISPAAGCWGLRGVPGGRRSDGTRGTRGRRVPLLPGPPSGGTPRHRRPRPPGGALCVAAGGVPQRLWGWATAATVGVNPPPKQVIAEPSPGEGANTLASLILKRISVFAFYWQFGNCLHFCSLVIF